MTIGPHTFRSTTAVMDGMFVIPLSAENRTAVGVSAGDEVDVTLELDTEPRTITVPPGCAAVMDAGARHAFDALSYSRRRQLVGGIEGAKTPETSERRIAKAVTAEDGDGRH